MELNWNHMAEYLREVCGKGRGEGEGGRSSADSHTHTAGWLWPWHWRRRGAWRTPGTPPAWLPSVHSHQAALGRNLVRPMSLTLSMSIQGPLAICGPYPRP